MMVAAFAQLVVSMIIAVSGVALLLIPIDRLHLVRIGILLIFATMVNIVTMVALLVHTREHGR